MNSGEFQARFLMNCAKNQVEPIKTAQVRVEEIDDEIRNLNREGIKKRSERKHLIDLIRSSGEKAVQNRNVPDEVIVPLEDDTQEARIIRMKIVTILTKNRETSLSVRDIMDETKVSREGQHDLIRQIKVLSEQGIIGRGEDNCLIQGTHWEQRASMIV